MSVIILEELLVLVCSFSFLGEAFPASRGSNKERRVGKCWGCFLEAHTQCLKMKMKMRQRAIYFFGSVREEEEEEGGCVK